VKPESVEQQLAIPLAKTRQRGGLDNRKVLGDYLSVTIDARGYLGSSKVSCPHYLVKKIKDDSRQYHHLGLNGS
jgi:hypothetical protein